MGSRDGGEEGGRWVWVHRGVWRFFLGLKRVKKAERRPKEVRRPKAETRKKAEVRGPKAEGGPKVGGPCSSF